MKLIDVHNVDKDLIEWVNVNQIESVHEDQDGLGSIIVLGSQRIIRTDKPLDRVLISISRVG